MGALYRRWGCHLFALVLAVIFYIFYQAWVSLYLLFVVILFPFFSLAISLPAMLSTSLDLTVTPDSLLREENGTVILTASTGGRVFPLRRIECVLRRKNLLTGEVKVSRPVFRSLSKSQKWQEVFSADHCGLLTFRVERIWVYDLSGLFVRQMTPPELTVRIITPIETPPNPPPAFPNGSEGHGALTLRRGGSGEDYDLRDYRAGDALRSIHWKLTAKSDKPMVKEVLAPRQPKLALSFDLWGRASALDATFDQLVWLSRQIVTQGHPHALCWLDPESGMPQEHAVIDEMGLNDCLMLLFSAPAPQTQREDRVIPVATRRRYVDWHYHILPQNRGIKESKGGGGQ